jgi:hypothetical protein
MQNPAHGVVVVVVVLEVVDDVVELVELVVVEVVDDVVELVVVDDELDDVVVVTGVPRQVNVAT